jgi:NADH-ubiquinone oxidoreductase complex I, 21 kDa subunit
MSQFPHKFPVVKPTPTVDDCLRAMRASDYFQWGGVTVASWGYGFMVGRPARFAMAGLMAGIGFTFGSMVILQNTRGRLMGFRENGRELKIYGQSNAQPEDFQPNWKEYN